MFNIIKLNIVFGLLFNAVAVVVSGMRLLTPIMAAIVHNVGSVFFVITSASLAIFPDTNLPVEHLGIPTAKLYGAIGKIML
jgi:Cd2+/Zn2+-exporting ATPase